MPYRILRVLDNWLLRDSQSVTAQVQAPQSQLQSQSQSPVRKQLIAMTSAEKAALYRRLKRVESVVAYYEAKARLYERGKRG